MSVGACRILVHLYFFHLISGVAVRERLPSWNTLKSERVQAPEHIGHRAWGNEEISKVAEMKSKVEPYDEFQQRQLGKSEESSENQVDLHHHSVNDKKDYLKHEEPTAQRKSKSRYEEFNSSRAKAANDYNMSERESLSRKRYQSQNSEGQDHGYSSEDFSSERINNSNDYESNRKNSNSTNSTRQQLQSGTLIKETSSLNKEENSSSDMTSNSQNNREYNKRKNYFDKDRHTSVHQREESSSSSNDDSSQSSKFKEHKNRTVITEKSQPLKASYGNIGDIEIKDRFSLPKSYTLKNIRSMVSPDLLYALASCGLKDEIAFVDSDFPTDSALCDNKKVIRLDGIPLQPLLIEVMNLWKLDTDLPLGVMLKNEEDVTEEIKNVLANIIAAEEDCGCFSTMENAELLTPEEFKQNVNRTRYVVKTGEIGPYNNIILRKGFVNVHCKSKCWDYESSDMKKANDVESNRHSHDPSSLISEKYEMDENTSPPVSQECENKATAAKSTGSEYDNHQQAPHSENEANTSKGVTDLDELNDIINEDEIDKNLGYLDKMKEGNQMDENHSETFLETNGTQIESQQETKETEDKPMEHQEKYRKTVELELNGTFPNENKEDGEVLMNIQALTKQKSKDHMEEEEEDMQEPKVNEKPSEENGDEIVEANTKIPYNEDYYFLEHKPLRDDVPQPRFSDENVDDDSNNNSDGRSSQSSNVNENQDDGIEKRREFELESRVPGEKPSVVTVPEHEVDETNMEESQLKSLDGPEADRSRVLGSMPPAP